MSGWTGWTDERVEHLKTRWAEGASGADIARELNRAAGETAVTRASVIGKVHRLGLPQRSQDAARAASKINGRARSADPNVALLRPHARVRDEAHPWGATSPAVSPKPLPKSPPAGIATAPRPWLSRQFGECAFPVGGEGADTLSCCNRTEEGKPYCPDHVEVMKGKTRVVEWSQEQRDRQRARAIAGNEARRQRRAAG